MKEFYDDYGYILRFSKGEEVKLPREDVDTEKVRYPESGIVCVIHKSKYKKGLKHNSADGEQSVKSKEPTNHITTETSATSTAGIDHDSTDGLQSYHITTDETPAAPVYNAYIHLADDNIIAFEGKLTDIRTGEIVGVCKHEDNLRRAYNTFADKTLSSLSSHNTLFVTSTLDGIVSYDRMKQDVAAFARWVKGLPNFKFGAYSLEPHEDGCWHVHLLVYFKQGIPEGCEDDITEWWNTRNGKACDEQVKVERVESDEHLLNILNYLKPTRREKRERIKFYPLGKQTFSVFGDVQKPDRSLAAFGEVKKEVGKEFEEHRRRLEKCDPQTGDVISFVARYLFKAKPDTPTSPPPPTEISKRDYFTCNDGDCDKCSRRSGCDRHGNCYYCFGYDTSYCRGCIWYESG